MGKQILSHQQASTELMAWRFPRSADGRWKTPCTHLMVMNREALLILQWAQLVLAQSWGPTKPPHLQCRSGALAMPFTQVTAFFWVTGTLRPLEIFCCTQRLSSAKHLQGEAPWRQLQPEPATWTVVSWVRIPCSQSPGWQKIGMDPLGWKEQNLWGGFLLCMPSKPFTSIAQLGLRTELGVTSGLLVSRTQVLQMMQTPSTAACCQRNCPVPIALQENPSLSYLFQRV